MKLLSLRSGRLGLDLAPQAGGSIARFTADGSIDLLRPATPQAVASGRGNDSSCYPLVPFSGRIANGRFVFDGSEIVLKPNWPGVRHPMHGDGWARPWTRRAQRRPLRRHRLRARPARRLALPLPRPPDLPSRRRHAVDRHQHREPGKPARAGRPGAASVLRARRRCRARLPHPAGLADRRRSAADGAYRGAAGMGFRAGRARSTRSRSTAASRAGTAAPRSCGPRSGFVSRWQRRRRSATSSSTSRRASPISASNR